MGPIPLIPILKITVKKTLETKLPTTVKISAKFSSCTNPDHASSRHLVLQSPNNLPKPEIREYFLYCMSHFSDFPTVQQGVQGGI